MLIWNENRIGYTGILLIDKLKQVFPSLAFLLPQLLEQVTELIPEDLNELLGIGAMYEKVKDAIVAGVVESGTSHLKLNFFWLHVRQRPFVCYHF